MMLSSSFPVCPGHPILPISSHPFHYFLLLSVCFLLHAIKSISFKLWFLLFFIVICGGLCQISDTPVSFTLCVVGVLSSCQNQSSRVGLSRLVDVINYVNMSTRVYVQRSVAASGVSRDSPGQAPATRLRLRPSKVWDYF